MYNKLIDVDKIKEEVPLKNFDEFEHDNMFSGGAPKQFMLCSGSYLIDMFRELRNDPNTNFVTCVDKLIKDETYSEEDFKNFDVSVMVKQCRSINKASAVNELVACRLANIFGVKTQYVAPVKNDENSYIIVDYLSDDQHTETFYHFMPNFNAHGYYYSIGDSCIRNWLNPLIKTAATFNKTKTFKQKFKDIEPLISDFIRLYLFKKYIIYDADFCSVNVSVVYDKNCKNLRLAPGYDYDCIFEPDSDDILPESLNDDIKYLAKTYPHILDKVVDDFRITGEKSERIVKVFNDFISSKRQTKNINHLVKYGVNSITSLTDKYLNKENKSNEDLIEDTQIQL